MSTNNTKQKAGFANFAGPFFSFAVLDTLLYFIYTKMPLVSERFSDTLQDRLLFVLRLQAIPAFLFTFNVFVVTLYRMASQPLGLNPLTSKTNEPYAMKVHNRVLKHFVQQYLVFLPLSFGFAAYADGSVFDMRAVVIYFAIFVLGRLLFWFGYVFHEAARIPGALLHIHPQMWIAGYLSYAAFNDVLRRMF